MESPTATYIDEGIVRLARSIGIAEVKLEVNTIHKTQISLYKSSTPFRHLFHFILTLVSVNYLYAIATKAKNHIVQIG